MDLSLSLSVARVLVMIKTRETSIPRYSEAWDWNWYERSARKFAEVLSALPAGNTLDPKP